MQEARWQLADVVLKMAGVLVILGEKQLEEGPQSLSYFISKETKIVE